MLANLLPGVRELRTSFAVGCIWIFCAWALVGDQFPNKRQASGFLLRLYQLGEFGGKAAVFTVAGFAAYLLGSLVTVTPDHLFRLYSPCSPGARVARLLRLLVPWPLKLLRYESEETLSLYMTQEASDEYLDHDTALHVLDEYIGRDVGRAVEYSFSRDRHLLSTNLQLASPELYAEYDRLNNEGGLRLTVGLHCWVLWFTLAASWSPYWLAGACASVLLIKQGYSRARDANDLLAQAIVAGIVSSPTLTACISEVGPELEGALDDLRNPPEAGAVNFDIP